MAIIPATSPDVALPEIDRGAVLFAACDVLVLSALEKVGKRIARKDRSRMASLRDVPWPEVHLHYRADDEMVDKGLTGAWDLAYSLHHGTLCCGITEQLLVMMLDGYVRELIEHGVAHVPEELDRRLAQLAAAASGISSR